MYRDNVLLLKFSLCVITFFFYFLVENPEKIYLSQVIKVNIYSISHADGMYSCYEVIKMTLPLQSSFQKYITLV